MTRVRKIAMGVLALLAALGLWAGLTSCGEKGEAPSYGLGEEGTYYRDTGEGECLLILREGTFVFTSPDGTDAAGTYEHGEGLVTLVFDGGGKVEGTPSPDALTLAGPSGTVTFLRRRYYRVVFVDGGETLSEQSVLNGKAARDPGEPEREGCVFVGWYADEDFTERYAFDAAVTDNTVVFARFVEASSGAAEYVITYDYTGEKAETVNGVVYDLPEPERSGYALLGWWVSATNRSDELTYRYDGETLFEDTTLFAFWVEGTSYVGASVYDDKVTWENYSAAVTDIVLRDEEGTEIDRFVIQSTDGRYDYDFASLPAGKYTLTIQGGGVDETLVYVSDGLSRASGFTVISGSILMYSAVENAERYYISIDCGTEGHDHEMVDNGTSLYYDFSSCDMPADGITFTVVAYAEGYYYSVSSFNYFLGLEKTEVTVEGNTVSWDPVPCAMEYEIYIDGVLVAAASDTVWSLADYGAGTYEIAVRPVTKGYWSETSEAVSFTKTTLAVPRITGLDGYVLTWTPVDGAVGYMVMTDGVSTYVGGSAAAELWLDADGFRGDTDVHEISVCAVAPDRVNDSPYGDVLYVTGASVGSAVSYERGTVTWQYSLSAAEYRITVNDGDELVITGTNSAAVTLTKSGNNEITIYFVNDDGDVYGQASTTVCAYAVVLDARGGSLDVDAVYVAKGDAPDLPTPAYPGGTMEFGGWYTLPDASSDGLSEVYGGDGHLFGDGTVFTGNSTMVLYAFWYARRVTVVLDPGMGYLAGEGDAVHEARIILGSDSFSVEVPAFSDPTYVFAGWYSGPDGTGTRYTDENGDGLAALDGTVTTLFAFWAQALSYSEVTYNSRQVIAVSAGPEISLVPSVTIPETCVFGGEERTVEVITGTAFANIGNLETVNAPDTIIYIDMTNNGYDSGTGAFAGTALKNFNVYATGEPSTTREIAYYSEDGVLFRKTEDGDAELMYYPYGRDDESYSIPETVSNGNELEFSGVRETPVVRRVNAICGSAFRGHSELVRMTIPEYVTTIGTYTFYNCTSLAYVTFEADIDTVEAYMFYGCSSLRAIDIPDGVREIGNSAFRNCSSLETVTIPDGVETVGTYVFAGCSSLETAHVSAGLETMGNFMFQNCPSLRGVDIPYGVREIGQYAFQNCTSLSRIVIPDSVETLGTYLFDGCSSLGDVTLPSSVTAVPNCCFRGCSSLESIAVPSGVVRIGSYAFSDCASLSDVSLPATLETIDSYAFQGCVSIVSITIPSSVTYIADGAFEGCYRIMEVRNLSSLSIEAGSETHGGVARYAKYVTDDAGEPGRISAADGGFMFVCDAEGAYTLFEYVGTDTDVTLPDDVDGHAYDINDYAFYADDRITSVVIPSCVETIGGYAFYGCTSLVKATIGPGVTAIGEEAFGLCYRLAEICDLSSLSIEAGSEANGGAGLHAKSVVSSEDETGLICDGDFLFVCDGMDGYWLVGYYGDGTSVTLPVSVGGCGYAVMEYAFYGRDDLTRVALGDGVTGVGDHAFYGCTVLSSVSFGRNAGYIGDYAFYGCAALGAIDVSEATETIGDYAFYNCSSAETLDLHGRITRIGEYCFYGCSRIMSADVPATCRYLGSRAFYGCYSLETATLRDGLETLGSHSFYNCRALKSVYVPAGVTEIGDGTFQSCTSLSSVSLPDGLVSIGNNAFYGCESLASPVFPDSLVSIGYYAFDTCTSITTVNIPASLRSVGYGAFQRDEKISSVYVEDLAALCGMEYSLSTSGGFVVGTNPLYYGAALYVGGSRVTALAIPSGVTEIAMAAFIGCGSITSVTVPDSVTAIGNRAFGSCTALTSVQLGQGVRSLGEYCFYGCSSLKSVNLPEGIEEIPAYLFQSCSALESAPLPDGLTSIGKYAFSGCKKITGVTIPGSVKTVGDDCFQNCTGLVTAAAEDGVTSLGSYTFYGCTSLERVTLPDSLTEIGSYMFYNCSKLESITIPGSVKTIGSNAFYGCSKIGSVIVPDSVTSIQQYAFRNCSSLEWIVIGSGVVNISNSAFNGCTKLSAVYYVGDEAGWNKISIGSSNNTALTGAARYYYSETEPQAAGNWWHWDEEGGVAVW